MTERTKNEYERFIEGHQKGHFMQSASWGDVKNDNWKSETLLVRGANGEIKGSLMVLIRKVPGLPFSIMYGSRGPVCDLSDRAVLSELMEGVKALAKKYRSYVLKLDPDVSSSDGEFQKLAEELGFRLPKEVKNFEGIQPRYVFRLYLNGRGEEELLASFHQKTRYNIRVAEKKGVVVRRGTREDLKSFSILMKETGERDRFITRGQGYFEKMWDSLGENLRLYMAYLEGVPIAGTIAIYHSKKVWYLYGASGNEYRNYMPNYLLQFEMMKWAVEKGCEIYDFRGVSGDLSEDNPLYGLYKFKKGFNGEFTEFVGELEYIFSRPAYFLVERGAKAFKKLRGSILIKKRRK